MQQAAAAAYDVLRECWPDVRRVIVCAGVGNNAGDGYYLAALASAAGCAVTLLQLEGRALTGAAGEAQQSLPPTVTRIDVTSSEGPIWDRAIAALTTADLVVDALLGIGLSTAPRPLFAALIERMNQAPAPVFALDVPSGLDADRGSAPGALVQAAHTATFLVDKVALHSGAGVGGTVSVHPLGLPARALATQPGLRALRGDDLSLPPLPKTVYKHRLGHLVVVGGDQGMGGATMLAAEAGLRSGAGMVSLITRPEHVAPALARLPELMVCSTARWPAVLALLARADVMVCGPGLGQGAWGRALLNAVLAAPGQRVLDADALNLLADPTHSTPVPPGAILTPHSGEAARLLGQPSSTIEADRLSAVNELSTRYQAVAVLKGPGTLIGAPEAPPALCLEGQPGMASAGMGDVLAGLAGGLLAQLTRVADPAADAFAAPWAAAAGAVVLHGTAGGRAGERGAVRTLSASVLLEMLPAVIAAAEARGQGGQGRRDHE